MNHQAMESVYTYSKNEGAEFAVLAAIAAFENYKTGDCFPSNVTIAKLAHVSEKTVQRAIPKLVESGELIVKGGYGTGKRRTLTINLPKVAPIANVQNHNGISDNMSRIDNENVQNISTNQDKMSRNSQMSRIENAISDILQKISDMERRILDTESKILDILSTEVIEVKEEKEKINKKEKAKSGEGDKYPLPSGFEFPERLRNDEKFMEVWDEWENSRKENKKPLTPTARKMQLAKANKHKIKDAVWVISRSIENGWQGLFWDKLNTRQHSQQVGAWKM